MPVEMVEEFLARVETGNRVQIPVLVRWKNRLEIGEILRVYVHHGFASGNFYARYRKDFRITIPKLVVEDLEVKPGDVVEVSLHSGP